MYVINYSAKPAALGGCDLPTKSWILLLEDVYLSGEFLFCLFRNRPLGEGDHAISKLLLTNYMGCMVCLYGIRLHSLSMFLLSVTPWSACQIVQ